MFSLKLFGAVSIAAEDGPLAGPAAQRRRLALLALLAAAPEGGVSRDKLIGFLWPDTDPDQARRFLADSVYALRKAMSQEAIFAAGDNLQLNTAILMSDVVEFRRALARSEWEAAAALYSGPFLDGFSLSGPAEFEQWADVERAELARKYADALERLARDAESRGQHARASSWWRQLQVADPLNSRVALSLVTALDASGDPAAALRHVRIHETMLREELGIAPGPELVAFAERLRSAPDGPPAAAATTRATPSPAPLPTLSSEARATPSPEPLATVDATMVEPEPAPSGITVRTQSGRRAWLAALLLVATLIAGALVFRSPRPAHERVLVTAFENRTGDAALDAIGSMAADWIARGLLQTGSLEVVAPTWTIYSVAPDADRTAAAIAGQAGAGTLVSGVYYIDDGSLRIEAQITDPERGRLLQALEPVTVPIDSGTAGVELIRQRVAAALAARFAGSQELREITARSQPPTYASYTEYLEGVRLFSRFQAEQATEHLDRAWSLDTTFHLARLYGALAALNVGNSARGDSLVRFLEVRRDRMATFDRILLDAFQADLRGDRAGLLGAMRRVAAMAPGSTFTIGHAVAAIGSNRPREALKTLVRLDPTVGLVRDNPRYWDWLTISRHLLGQHRRELREGRQGQALLEPGSMLAAEIRALAALGRVTELDALLNVSLSLSPQHPAGTPGDVMRGAAAELRAHGHDEAAARTLAKAIAWYRDRPEEERARHRNALARTFYHAGQWAEARELLEDQAAEQPVNIGVLGQMGVIAVRQGESAEAGRISAMLAAPSQPRGTATLWRARIAAQLGQHGQAVSLLREALSQGVIHGMWLHTDPDFAVLRDDRAFRELVRPDG
jgi:DNA-binding SARP family transcriptional activator/TolB-like protein